MRADHAAVRGRATGERAARHSRGMGNRRGDSDWLSGRARPRPDHSPPGSRSHLPGCMGSQHRVGRHSPGLRDKAKSRLNHFGLTVTSAGSAIALPWHRRFRVGDIFVTPERRAASSAGGVVMANLHRYPLLRPDVPLQCVGTTVWAFFSHSSLPVRSARTSLKIVSVKPRTPSHGPMVPESCFQYQ